MQAFKTLFLSFAVVLIAFTSAYAIPAIGNLTVDFRTSAWSGADNQASFAVGTATAAALPAGRTLFQDNVDGLGVRGGSENDEIDQAEQIRVTFAGGKNLRGFWVTDLFASPDGAGDPLGEHGRIVINGGALTIDFYGNNSDQANGEQFIDFGTDYLVTSAVFSAIGTATNNANNEFSVAGAVAAPEPITMLLLGTGLLGLATLRRRFI